MMMALIVILERENRVETERNKGVV